MASRSTFFLAAILLAPTLGCATIINRSTTNLPVRSDPKGIQVSTMNAGNRIDCTTDCYLELNNNEDHVLRFQDPEIVTTQRTITSHISAWFYVNLLFGLPGLGLMVIDWYTDSMYSLSHAEIFIEFIDNDEDNSQTDDIDDDDAFEDEPLTTENTLEPTTQRGFDETKAYTDAARSGVAALPAVSASDQAAIERIVPPSRIAQAISNYYGDVDEGRQRIIRDRLYRIMKHQMAYGDSIDLDLAVAIETHDRLD